MKLVKIDIEVEINNIKYNKVFESIKYKNFQEFIDNIICYIKIIYSK